jgi:hypothetical protein
MLLFGVLTRRPFSSSSLLSLVKMFSSIRKSTPPSNWSIDTSSCLLDYSFATLVFNPVRIFLVLIPPFESISCLRSLTLSILSCFWTFLNNFISIFMSFSCYVVDYWAESWSSFGPSSEMPSRTLPCRSARDLCCFFITLALEVWLLNDFSVYSLKLFS